MKPNIAFIGYMGVGKTTASDYLVEKHGYVKMSFAEPVKEIASIVLEDMDTFMDDNFGIAPVDAVDGWTPDLVNQQKGNPSIRKLLQLIGTELGRDRYGDIVWIDAMRDRINAHGWVSQKPIVIDDTRFLNEAEFLRREFGFKVIRLVRPLVYPNVITSDHRSETEIRKIVEDGGIESSSKKGLYQLIDSIIGDL